MWLGLLSIKDRLKAEAAGKVNDTINLKWNEVKALRVPSTAWCKLPRLDARWQQHCNIRSVSHSQPPLTDQDNLRDMRFSQRR